MQIQLVVREALGVFHTLLLHLQHLSKKKVVIFKTLCNEDLHSGVKSDCGDQCCLFHLQTNSIDFHLIVNISTSFPKVVIAKGYFISDPLIGHQTLRVY